MNSIVGKIGLFLLTNAITLVTLVQAIAPVKAQITPANTNDTNTTVIKNNGTYNINGGTTSTTGTNLFHSFQTFGLNQGEIANFNPNANILNILGRVVGGSPSIINGTIQVTGNANLFLMNPAGIVFGSTSVLNVNGDFTATTATGIKFANGILNSEGVNNYTNLDGSVEGFNFANQQTGNILNVANLGVTNSNQNLNLIGGTVVNSGQLSAPNGNIIVASVQGGKFLRISQPGNILGIEVPQSQNPTTIAPSTLADLLTGIGGSATGLTVNNGQLVLTGSGSGTGIPVNTGDIGIQSGQFNATSTTISAASNLYVVGSSFQATSTSLTLETRNTLNNIFLGAASFESNGGITLNGNVILNSNVSFNNNSNPGDIIFKGTINGARQLSILATSSNVNFDDDIGKTTPLTNLVISNAVNTNIAKNIFTTGTQSFSSPVTLTGTNSNQEFSANNTIGFGKALTAGNNNLTLTASEINFLGGANSVTGSGKLVLQPSTLGQNINIGGTTDAGASSLDILKTDLDALAKGFSSITIGRDNSSGSITVLNAVTFKNAVKIQSPSGGSITTNAAITGQGSVTLDAVNTTLNAGITTTNQNITVGQKIVLGNDITLDTGAGAGDIQLNGTVNGNKNLTLNAGTGNITFTAKIGDTQGVGDLVANSTGTTQFGNTVQAGTVTTDAGGTTQINADITTTGVQTYNDAVNVANNPTLKGVGITFGNTVDGNSNLTANAQTGNLTFTEAVGAIAQLGDLVANSTGTTQFGNTVQAGTVTTDAGGTTQINADITTTGAQTYNDAVTVANNPTLKGVGITFGSTVDGNSKLTANAQTGNLNFNGKVGSQTPLKDLVASGATKINADITTTGAQTYNDAVTVANNPTLKGVGITFGNTVDGIGNSSLTANAQTGNLIFSGAVGTNTPVQDLTLTGDGIDFLGGANSVKGSGKLVLQPFTPGQDINIAGTTDAGASSLDILNTDIDALAKGFSSITIGGDNSSGSITVLNAVTFKDAVKIQSPSGTTGSITTNANAGITGQGSVTLDAVNTTLNAGITTTNQNITVGQKIALGNDITLDTGADGGDIQLNGTVNGNKNLTLNAGTGNITLKDKVGDTQPLGDLVANSTGTTKFENTVKAGTLTTDAGGTTQINADITTTGAQTYNDAVTVANDPTLKVSHIKRSWDYFW